MSEALRFHRKAADDAMHKHQQQQLQQKHLMMQQQHKQQQQQQPSLDQKHRNSVEITFIDQLNRIKLIPIWNDFRTETIELH